MVRLTTLCLHRMALCMQPQLMLTATFRQRMGIWAWWAQSANASGLSKAVDCKSPGHLEQLAAQMSKSWLMLTVSTRSGVLSLGAPSPALPYILHMHFADWWVRVRNPRNHWYILSWQWSWLSHWSWRIWPDCPCTYCRCVSNRPAKVPWVLQHPWAELVTKLLIGCKPARWHTVDIAGAGDHPKVAAMKERMRQRTAQQEADEQAAKQQLAEKANQHLENFYQVSTHLTACTIHDIVLRLLSALTLAVGLATHE